MFTVQKGRVSCLSDLEGRNNGIVSDTPVLTGHVADISKALSTFVSATLGKGNQKGELQIWANLTVPKLSPEVQKLIASIIKKSEDGKEIYGWGWGGQQDADIKDAIAPYLPK